MTNRAKQSAMKQGRRELVLICATVIAAGGIGVAISASAAKQKKPPAKVSIDGCKKKKPPVVFDHARHLKLKKHGVKCVTCHHKVDNKPAKKDRCTDCHRKKRGDLGTCFDKSKRKNPIHRLCVSCHKKMAKNPALTKKGPTKCKQCHAKK